MKKCVLFLFTMTILSWRAHADSSRVYSCHFTDEINALTSLRMKDYFDANLNMDMGKVDLLVGQDVKESTQTQVLQVPLWESDTYLKIWYAATLRIDAKLSWSSSSREFEATYIKNSVQRPIYCTKMND